MCSSCLLAVVARAEEPARVDICEVRTDPAAYNHKLIEVTAFVAHGFEEFTLFDPTCASRHQIWLEYGGTVASGTTYCCGATGDRGRSQPLEIENTLIPLVNDERFQEFDRIIQRRPDSILRATVVGRFFSGRQQQLGSGVLWGGYGHMGCCTLLAIQQVLWVDRQSRTDLDYRASPDQPNMSRAGCSYRDLVPPESSTSHIVTQREAERGQTEWVFTDPKRVATTALMKLLNTTSETISAIRETRKSQGRMVYQWKPEGRRKTYTIVASRPYWLSFYANDASKVAWVIIAAYEASCK